MGHYVIIGGGGFLGAHIISRLQLHEKKRRIIVVDPNPMIFKTIEIDPDYVTYKKESFLDAKVLDKVLPGASAVFHLAAIGHTGLRYWDKKAIFDFNVEGTKKLVDKCQENHVSRFVYASSVAVAFVGEPLNGATEDDPLPHPRHYLDYYSASKAEAESFVLRQSKEGFRTTALRFRAIYGPEDPNVTRKVANLIRNGMFFGIISLHDRESISASSSGVNCANAFYLADQALQKQNALHGRAYFIVDDCNVGQYEFWTPLIMALGKQPPTSIERARRELGYKPEPSLMPAVAAYYEQLQQVKGQRKQEQERYLFQIILVAFLIFVLAIVLHRMCTL